MTLGGINVADACSGLRRGVGNDDGRPVRRRSEVLAGACGSVVAAEPRRRQSGPLMWH